jgi:hypothetical protein
VERILSDDGRDLATAIVESGQDSMTVTLARVVDGKGRLLQYYFGAGRRAVLLDKGALQLHGTLRTKWMGAERRWYIHMQPAVAEAPGRRAPAGGASGRDAA